MSSLSVTVNPCPFPARGRCWAAVMLSTTAVGSAASVAATSLVACISNCRVAAAKALRSPPRASWRRYRRWSGRRSTAAQPGDLQQERRRSPATPSSRRRSPAHCRACPAARAHGVSAGGSSPGASGKLLTARGDGGDGFRAARMDARRAGRGVGWAIDGRSPLPRRRHRAFLARAQARTIIETLSAPPRSFATPISASTAPGGNVATVCSISRGKRSASARRCGTGDRRGARAR